MPFSRLRSTNQRAVYRGSRRADIDTCSSLDRDKPLKNKSTAYIYMNKRHKESRRDWKEWTEKMRRKKLNNKLRIEIHIGVESIWRKEINGAQAVELSYWDEEESWKWERRDRRYTSRVRECERRVEESDRWYTLCLPLRNKRR